jgi:hypothetical protein
VKPEFPKKPSYEVMSGYDRLSGRKPAPRITKTTRTQVSLNLEGWSLPGTVIHSFIYSFIQQDKGILKVQGQPGLHRETLS